MSARREKHELAARLCAAYENLPALKAAAKKVRPRDPHHEWRCLSVSVGDRCSAGMVHDVSVDVDIETGRRIVAAVEAIVRERMAELGV